MTEFNLRYTISEKEFMEAYNAHWVANKQSSASSIRLGLLGTLGGIVYAINYDIYGVFLTGIGILLVLLPALRHYLYARNFRENEKLNGEVDASFGEEDIQVRKSGAESKLKWSIFIRYLETEKFLLIYYSEKGFSIIPKSALGEEWPAFVQFAKEKID